MPDELLEGLRQPQEQLALPVDDDLFRLGCRQQDAFGLAPHFVVEDESGDLIGRIFLRHVRHEEGSAVLGIDLHPGYLGRGYGTESLGAFLHHYFEHLGFQRMLLSVAAHNVRARRCYESLGFTTVGSHWDAHIGPDVTREPQFAFVRQLFRRGPLGLESLFHDMRLERADWKKRLSL